MTSATAARGIAVDAVSVRLGGRVVVDAVSLAVEPGEWLGVAGPNGAGKTTLLRVLAGLQAHDGSVDVDGVAVSGMGRRDQARAIALVPQNPVLPEQMRVYDYVLLGRTPHLGRRLAVTVGDERVAAAVVERLGLAEFAARPLGALSGGERQRAVIGRALAQNTSILLLDEPTASLDLGHQQDVLELIDGLRREHGLTVVMTMHDLTLAAQFADRLALLAGGRLVALGPPAEALGPELLGIVYGADVTVIETPGGPVVVPQRRR